MSTDISKCKHWNWTEVQYYTKFQCNGCGLVITDWDVQFSRPGATCILLNGYTVKYKSNGWQQESYHPLPEFSKALPDSQSMRPFQHCDSCGGIGRHKLQCPLDNGV